MVAVGARDAAVEGRELPLGQVAGDLEVVEGVFFVQVADQVDEIEAGEQVPGEAGPVGQDARDEQDEQRVAQPGGQYYTPPPDSGSGRPERANDPSAPFTVRRSPPHRLPTLSRFESG